MPSLCAQAFLRFETRHSTELKKSLDIFCPRLERKQSKEYLVILLVVKRKLWKIFLPRVHLEKYQTRSRLKTLAKICKVLFMTQDFQGHVALKLYMSSSIKIVVLLNVSLNYIFCLDCQNLFLITLSVVFSRTSIAC